MPRLNRAKLFAPFAALSGFERCIRSSEIVYESRRALSDAAMERLNRQLVRLSKHPDATVTVEYFEVCADPHHEGFGRLGQYRRLKGAAHRPDHLRQTLRVDDTDIRFEDLYRLEVNARG